MIRYRSTRGESPSLTFAETVMAGLAPDGGLYLPDRLPAFTPQEIAGFGALSYAELAFRVIRPFTGDCLPETDLKSLINDAYADFRHPAIAPLKQLAHNEYLLELFHGPTLAFKDFALQLLGRLLEYFLTRTPGHLTIIGATSGDTGSAAIEACRGRKNMRIVILHPHGRVSDVQRRQMTGVADANVHNLAIEGTFDDCQDIVKALFADAAFRKAQQLTAVNSINWARILAQVVYYFYAAAALGAPARALRFCVPTGNFGDIYAGYLAKRMGLPVERLVIATNSNDILARCLTTGIYGMQGVHPTLSPSMDIQISSNFERLLFDLHDGDAAAIAQLMQDFRAHKQFTLSPRTLARLIRDFASARADDAQTRMTIQDVFRETGELIDPHTAVGLAAAAQIPRLPDVPLITLATAHPAKFPDAVLAATGLHPNLPPHLADLAVRPERFTVLPADAGTVKDYIEQRIL